MIPFLERRPTALFRLSAGPKTAAPGASARSKAAGPKALLRELERLAPHFGTLLLLPVGQNRYDVGLYHLSLFLDSSDRLAAVHFGCIRTAYAAACLGASIFSDLSDSLLLICGQLESLGNLGTIEAAKPSR